MKMLTTSKSALSAAFQISKCLVNRGQAGANLKAFSTSSALLSGEPPVLVEVKDSVQWIRLNRPKQYNALSNDAYAQLIEALEGASKNEQVRIAVITGTGKFFSSGNDLNNHYNRAAQLNCDLMTSAKAGVDQVERLVNVFIDFPKLLVGAINGPAYGIMVTTLAFYDYIFASNKASFTTPFTRLGIIPEGCSSYTFPQILGPSVANKVLTLNETLSVERAYQLGFVTEVVPAEELENKVSEWLYDPKKGVLANCNALAMLKAKEVLRTEETRQKLREINKKECEQIKELYVSGDVFKNIEKFRSKKKD